MELTPDLLLEAKFSPSRRGYDMAEVDDFLERCAEGLDVLLTRLRAEFDRAERAEAELRGSNGHGTTLTSDTGRTEHVGPAFEPEPEPIEPEAEADPSEPDEDADEPSPKTTAVGEPMRILIAAERTAEAAVAEARAEAERIRTEAEAEAREAGEAARGAIESEVKVLRADRESLSENVRLLRDWMDDQRVRLRSTAETLQRLVDDPAAIGAVAAPPAIVDDPSDHAAVGDGPHLFDVESDGEPTQAVPAFGDDPFADEGSDADASNDPLP